jgi:hypothetical protein
MPDGKKPAGIWRVNAERLDDRIEGQRDLVTEVVVLGRAGIAGPSTIKHGFVDVP